VFTRLSENAPISSSTSSSCGRRRPSSGKCLRWVSA
jgi:hypothetical protein